MAKLVDVAMQKQDVHLGLRVELHIDYGLLRHEDQVLGHGLVAGSPRFDSL